MPQLFESPSIVQAAGIKPKQIEEFIGNVNSKTDQVSIARMKSPCGWEEPGQTPEFDEYSIVLKGMLRAETKEKIYEVSEGQAILISKNEWIRYSTPGEEGAEYISVCIPAFSMDTVHRDKKK